MNLLEVSNEAVAINPFLFVDNSLVDFTAIGSMHMEKAVIQNLLAAQRVLVEKQKQLSNLQGISITTASKEDTRSKKFTECFVVASLQERKVAQQLKAIQHRRGFLSNAIFTQRQHSLRLKGNLTKLQQTQRRLSPNTNQTLIFTTSSPPLLKAAGLQMSIFQSTSPMVLQRALDEMSRNNIITPFLQC